MHDVNKETLTEIDIKASVKTGTLVVKHRQETRGLTLNAFYVQDSLLLTEEQTPDKVLLHKINQKKESLTTSLTISEMSDNPELSPRGVMCFNNTQKLVAKSMHNSSRIDFLDLQTDNRSAVELKVSPQKDGEIWMRDCGMDGNTKGLYILIKDHSSEEEPLDLYQFDWSGNLIYRYQLQEPIQKIAVDKDGRFLFGLDYSGNIFRYALFEE